MNLRKPRDNETFEARQRTSKEEDNEWWLRYASKLHLNHSESLKLRKRRDVSDGLGNAGFYAHLDALTHDLLEALSLTFLRVYTNGGRNDTIFLQKVARHPGQSWTAWPCTDAALPSGLHRELILVLCDNTTTDQLLAKVMEIVPEVEGGAFTLYEMWSPGGSVGLKSGLAGIWTSNSDFQGRTASYPWTLATARLRLYPQALYERRSDLTGVHFIVTSINDTRAQKSHFDKTLGREVLTGYFGDVWELFKTEMNFTYSVTTPSDGEFGSLTKGRWTGLIGDVLSGQAHVIVAQLSQTYSRAQVIDYSSVLIKFR
ncbi:Glutamate receptor ionotropic, NMDA 3B [Portunus trituberculatus]|uniref:Glutamate receptor ionotropic, NMDA 3B n=1 Tax=Portunus trituberculatus TaxID=210409 RepID=A0A5B7DB34_PORTR|nr:Glutamate receptor ionotropic, NMDA 3B [Portunus trituberculatus]